MSKKPFERIKNTAPQPPMPNNDFQIKVVQRQFLLLQQQVANLSVQASHLIAERDILAEDNVALHARIAALEAKG